MCAKMRFLLSVLIFALAPFALANPNSIDDFPLSREYLPATLEKLRLEVAEIRLVAIELAALDAGNEEYFSLLNPLKFRQFLAEFRGGTQPHRETIKALFHRHGYALGLATRKARVYLEITKILENPKTGHFRIIRLLPWFESEIGGPDEIKYEFNLLLTELESVQTQWETLKQKELKAISESRRINAPLLRSLFTKNSRYTSETQNLLSAQRYEFIEAITEWGKSLALGLRRATETSNLGGTIRLSNAIASNGLQEAVDELRPIMNEIKVDQCREVVELYSPSAWK